MKQTCLKCKRTVPVDGPWNVSVARCEACKDDYDWITGRPTRKVTLRQRLVHAAITSLALGAVLLTGCDPDAGESGLPQTHTTTVGPEDPCKVASRIADYVVRYEDGTTVYVTPREDVRQASLRGLNGARLTAECSKIVRQAVKDGQSVR